MAQKIKKISKKLVALICIFTLVFSYSVTTKTNAAIAEEELKLSDSRASQAADHDLEADLDASATGCIQIEYCTTASGGCTPPTGLTTVGLDKGESADWASLVYNDWTVASVNANTAKLTHGTTATPSGTDDSVVFGAVTNPSGTGVYFGRISTFSVNDCTGAISTAVTAFYIISDVTVTVTVDETLSFAIDGVTGAACDASFSALDGPDSSATAITFTDTIIPDTFYHACQDLTVGTNATNGYFVTAQETTNLMYSTDTIDDSTGDTPQMTESTTDTWADSTKNGVAYGCVDITGDDCVFTANTEYRQYACTGTDAQCDISGGAETPQTIMTDAAEVDGNVSRIQYKISVSASQPAGTYTGQIVYVATPTY